ncbi:MAG: SiaB family protein kinase [Oscillospiraceae bacterium]|nr:SiaB family protein kinase [Oscillospiraceae bacterium]
MVLNMREYSNKFKEMNINVSYSGPMWDDGVKGIAEMVKTSLSHDELSGKASKIIFSVFVEQVTNMLMYSAEKEQYGTTEREEVSTGMLILGNRGRTYFIQTGNAIKNESMALVKGRIDHLNSLDKKELRQYHKERLRGENDNPESKGVGLGLIEIARRATAPIGYSFEMIDEKLSYFSMYVEIAQEVV